MRVLALLICLASLAASPIVGLRAYLALPPAERAALRDEPFAAAPLTKAEATEARQVLWADHLTEVERTRQVEWDAKSITIGDHTLRLKTKFVGKKPAGGWNLFISLHGGGGTAAAVNDQQWENQIKLYAPKDSLYVAPRAPTDHWNLWHEAHVDALIDRLIEDAVALAEVNPDRVYVMGYSAGGDGVYQLAPRMADRWAAAAMMAGHPNDASPLGLRNIGFAVHVGALDAAYHRNEIAQQWGEKLDALRKADPDGYAHLVKLHAGKAHWMDREDAEAVEWMQTFTRDALPAKVVWLQSPVTHDRCYWLAVPKASAKGGQLVVASRDGQTIEIEKAEGVAAVRVLLNDRMLDLDRPVVVRRDGKVLFEGKVTRTIGSIGQTLMERGDPRLVFDAGVDVAMR